jgi:hypothetical protein
MAFLMAATDISSSGPAHCTTPQPEVYRGWMGLHNTYNKSGESSKLYHVRLLLCAYQNAPYGIVSS